MTPDYCSFQSGPLTGSALKIKHHHYHKIAWSWKLVNVIMGLRVTSTDPWPTQICWPTSPVTRWPTVISGASTRRNVHSLTPILIIRHLLSTSSIHYNPKHPPCSICVLDSPLQQPLSRSSFVFLSVWDPLLHTPFLHPIIVFSQHMPTLSQPLCCTSNVICPCSWKFNLNAQTPNVSFQKCQKHIIASLTTQTAIMQTTTTTTV